MAYDLLAHNLDGRTMGSLTNTIEQEASRSRVAATFPPSDGPLPADTDYVPRERVEVRDQSGERRLAIDDTTTIPIPTLQVKVYVRGAQMSAPERPAYCSSSAERRTCSRASRTRRLRRAAGARCGFGAGGLATADLGAPGRGAVGRLAGRCAPGGLGSSRRRCAGDGRLRLDRRPREQRPLRPLCGRARPGTLHGRADADGIARPPQDRIIPFLEGGSLLRSTLLPAGRGVVVALGGSPVELVVATDISLDFLQVTTDPMFVFRVYEKVVLRIEAGDRPARSTGSTVTAARVIVIGGGVAGMSAAHRSSSAASR